MLQVESTINGVTKQLCFPPGEEIWIGRSSKCHIHEGLTQGDVSRQHARLQLANGCWTIEDQSKTGTLVNGAKLLNARSAPLNPEDEIRIGPMLLRVLEVEGRGAASNTAPVSPALTLTSVDIAQLDPKVVLNSALDLPRLFGEANDEADVLEQACNYLVKVLSPVITAAYAVESRPNALTEPTLLARCSSSERTKGVVLSRRIFNEVIANPDSVVFQNESSDKQIDATVAPATRTVGACLIEQSPEGIPVVIYVVGTSIVLDGQELAAGYLRLVSTLTKQHIIAHRRSHMTRYFSPRVVDLLMRRGGLARAEGAPRILEATSLFFDLRGFSLSTAASAKDLLPLQRDLRRAMDIVTHEVFAEDGTVIDYQGDGCFAAWGVPFDQSGQARAAVSAAQRILAGLRQTSLAAMHSGSGAVCGMGIAKGEVLAGSVGSSEHFKYGLLGPSVNWAARLEALTKPSRLHAPILITAEVASELGDGFRYVRAGRVHLAGAPEPIDVFEVIDVQRPLSGVDEARCWAELLEQLEGVRNPTALKGVERRCDELSISDDPRVQWFRAMCADLRQPHRLERWDGILRY